MIRALTIVLAGLMFAAAGASAADQTFPNRPITIINPFPPGGLADLTGRPLAAAMEKVLEQPVVIVNKSGAAGAVACSRWPSPSRTATRS